MSRLLIFASAMESAPDGTTGAHQLGSRQGLPRSKGARARILATLSGHYGPLGKPNAVSALPAFAPDTKILPFRIVSGEKYSRPPENVQRTLPLVSFSASRLLPDAM